MFFINGTSEWRDRTRAYENTEVYYWAYRQKRVFLHQSNHVTHSSLFGRRSKKADFVNPLVHVLNWAPSWKCIRIIRISVFNLCFRHYYSYYTIMSGPNKKNTNTGNSAYSSMTTFNEQDRRKILESLTADELATFQEAFTVFDKNQDGTITTKVRLHLGRIFHCVLNLALQTYSVWDVHSVIFQNIWYTLGSKWWRKVEQKLIQLHFMKCITRAKRRVKSFQTFR